MTTTSDPTTSDRTRCEPSAPSPRIPWWAPGLVLALALVGVSLWVMRQPSSAVEASGTAWWTLTLALHLPWFVILLFLIGGTVERIGYFWRGRAAVAPGQLPATAPRVCVQLPMFNEDTVARRVILAAAALRWPHDRIEIQVLDDSTDPVARAIVDDAAREAAAVHRVEITVLRRADRRGYKAGALEAGRKRTDAEFIAVFDADFSPAPDYLERAVPHFFLADGRLDRRLALVQARWGHLNEEQSGLTRAQALWVDDHHTVQMSWRSAMWQFVNFTGTAGVWQADAIEDAGGWRAASLVEDCELSFRHLFAGYRTMFVKEIAAAAELPATYTAYKAQQKRWTQGWAQVQRLHLRTLARDFVTSPARRLHLIYHMCIPWQWAAWALWIMMLPVLIHTGLWFGDEGMTTGLVVYVLPPTVWVIMMAIIAARETDDSYAGPRGTGARWRRHARILPYVVINTGMLPHQFSAFMEGLLGPLHSEFERTPKAALVSPRHGATAREDTPKPSSRPARRPRARVRIHPPYVVAEVCFACYQAAWAAFFLASGSPLAALGPMALAACVLYLGLFYGDSEGRLLFVLDRDRVADAWRSRMRRPRPLAERVGN